MKSNSSYTSQFPSRRRGVARAAMLLCSGTALASLALFVASPLGHAQAIYGAINGTITDATGAVVPNATVTVTDTDKGTKIAVTSGGSGEYLVQHLVPDHYVIHVEAPGFTAAETTGVKLEADSSPRFDFSLKTGGSEQIVQVSAEAPQLQTDQAEVSTTLNERSIQDLPNISRNATSFVLLSPGTTQSTFNNSISENPQLSTPVAAAGQSPFSAGFILDGADNKDSFLGVVIVNPPLDSIQELKFITQNYDAEFGAAVAGITVIQTKSGSNTFHGDAFEYRHSDAQQARDPFTQYPGNNPIGPDVPHALYNEFGGSAGGPVLKNKLFFFGDYQGVRQKVGSSFFQTVPTALVRSSCLTTATCDLSEYLNGGQGQVYDPATGDPITGAGRTPFAGNIIPTARLSSQGLNILGILPAPTTGGIFNNYVASGFGLFNTDQFDTRMDTQIGKTHVFGRYGYFKSTVSSPGGLGAAGGQGFQFSGFAGTSAGLNQDFAVGADLPVTSSLLTDFRFGYLRYTIKEEKYDGDVALATQLGIPGLNTGAAGSGGAPAFTVDGLSSFGSGNHGVNHCNCPLDQKEQEFEIVNNWTKTLGKHSIKVGGDLRYVMQTRFPSDENRSGELGFVASGTALGSPAAGTAPGGLGLATLLFANVNNFQRYISSATDASERQKRTFFYAQDSWKPFPNLTVNYGVRWEIFFPETVNGKGKGGFYDLATNQIRVAGYGNIGTNFNVKNNFTYFAPRLSVAYQAAPNTVVRAGYGRSFDPGYFGNIFGQVVTQTYPILISQGAYAQSSYSSAFTLAQGPPTFTPAPIPDSGLIPLPDGIYPTTRPNQMRLSYVDGWNLTVQQQFTPTLSFQIGYVGNKGTNQGTGSTYSAYNANQSTVKGFAAGETFCARSLFFKQNGYCGPGYIGYNGDIGNSHYNSLQTVLDKRFSKGLQVQANFTWSRAMANGNFGDYIVIDPSVEYGRFDYNREKNFTAFGNYELPFGKGRQFFQGAHGLLGNLIGGYAVNMTLNWASGLPYTPYYAECGADRDTGPCRPNQVSTLTQSVGALNTQNHTRTFFTPVAPLAANGQVSGAFSRPQVEQFGDVRYNSFFGPTFFASDASVLKNFTLHEKLVLQLQAQAQNVFNHMNPGNPNSCIDCTVASGAGTISGLIGTAPTRQMQFSGRISF